MLLLALQDHGSCAEKKQGKSTQHVSRNRSGLLDVHFQVRFLLVMLNGPLLQLGRVGEIF